MFAGYMALHKFMFMIQLWFTGQCSSYKITVLIELSISYALSSGNCRISIENCDPAYQHKLLK